jgi:hypothetical protein
VTSLYVLFRVGDCEYGLPASAGDVENIAVSVGRVRAATRDDADAMRVIMNALTDLVALRPGRTSIETS